jgi:hypothetical protein
MKKQNMNYRCQQRGVDCKQHSMSVEEFIKQLTSAGVSADYIVVADEIHKDKVGCQTWKNVILEVNGVRKHYTNINAKTVGYAVNWYKKNCYNLVGETQ